MPSIRLLVLLFVLPGAPFIHAAWLDSTDIDALTVLERGDTHVVDRAPLGGRLIGEMAFKRISLYSPEAEIRVVRNGVRSAARPSGRHFLVGRTTAQPGTVAVLSIDPATSNWTGSIHGPAGLEALRFYPEADGMRWRAYDLDTLMPDEAFTDFSCQSSLLDQGQRQPVALPSGRLGRDERSTTLRLGQIAIDTDAEWLDRRFNDDEDDAIAWIEELMLVTNTVFESQLDFRMVLGDIIIRIGSDPYDESDSPVSRDALLEFGDYWATNKDHIERTHAALISGRSHAEGSASGHAWVDSYCQTQASGGSYSVNQLFYATWAAIESSARVFAHELGHNLGSVHTHCFDPPIDECYADEAGCYSGSTSCPAEGSGTLMSYCSVGACGISNPNRLEFAPEVAALLDGRIVDNMPDCIVEDGEQVIFQDRFQ